MEILELFRYQPTCGDKLETKICGILMRNGITTVEALRKLSDKDLLKLRGIGYDSIDFIRNKLNELEESHIMAIIIGLEEKERVLKTIENKIKEVEDMNRFLSAFDKESTTISLTCLDMDKKRPKIKLNGDLSMLALFINEQRANLISEITVLCQANDIALNEEELEILSMKEPPNVLPEAYETHDAVIDNDTYIPSGHYDSGEDYTEA